MGPSTVGDSIGSGLGSLMYVPVWDATSATVSYGASALYFVDLRASFLDAEALVTGDRYVFMRDVYLQRRAYLIADGELDDPFLDDDWGDDWDDDDDWDADGDED